MCGCRLAFGRICRFVQRFLFRLHGCRCHLPCCDKFCSESRMGQRSPSMICLKKPISTRQTQKLSKEVKQEIIFTVALVLMNMVALNDRLCLSVDMNAIPLVVMNSVPPDNRSGRLIDDLNTSIPKHYN